MLSYLIVISQKYLFVQTKKRNIFQIVLGLSVDLRKSIW